jgi:hypothetical protein
VLLSYVNLKVAQGFWTWLDGKLFLPQGWFEESHKTLRERLGIPKSRLFKTKVELAWELIEGVISRGLSFERVGFDTLYGRSGWLRDKVRGVGRRYMLVVREESWGKYSYALCNAPADTPGEYGMISTGTGVTNSKRPSMGALAPSLNIKDTALIAQDRIDAIGQGLATCGGVEQLRQVDGTGALRFLGPARPMRAHDHIIQLVERQTRGRHGDSRLPLGLRGISVPYIESRCKQLPRFECTIERIFLHYRATGYIDENRIGWKQVQLLLANQARRLRGVRHTEDERIGLW